MTYFGLKRAAPVGEHFPPGTVGRPNVFFCSRLPVFRLIISGHVPIAARLSIHLIGVGNR